MIRSDNSDWGLYNKKISVWESSWTKQRGYTENTGVFIQAEQGSLPNDPFSAARHSPGNPPAR